MIKDNSQFLYDTAKKVAIIAGAFAVILSVLLIVNYVQTKIADPLNSEAINQLMLDFQKDQNNETLKAQIRALDLLARKAYFTNQWQIRTGGFMLFAFIMIFISSLKYLNSMRLAFPDLNKNYEPEKMWETKLAAKKYIIYSGIGLFVIAFLFSILTDKELSNFRPDSGDGNIVYPTMEEIKSNWPNFRGPEGIGIAYSDAPTEWNGESGENILWKMEIPVEGYNSPIIWGDKLFLSGADRKTQVVYCIDVETGAMIWEKELNEIPGTPENKPRNTEDTGYAAPTMATDGTGVFVMYGTGDIAGLDFDGNVLWSKNIGVPDNHYGHSSSLIIYKNMLLIQFDHNMGGKLMALNTVTGSQMYDQPRDSGISWASPILVNTGNRDEIILSSNPFVVSYDPHTGRELWRVACMMGEVAPSLGYANNVAFVVNENASLVAIEVGDSAKVLWDGDDDLSEVSSPVATKDYLFVAASYGTVSCFDARTGERYWYQDFRDGFYSSPILVGENVYLMDMNGSTYIFKADKEYTQVAKNELGESVVSVPVVMHGRIYVRGIKNLYCIGK